jgi:predicted amidohydrolase YtcJ
MLPLRGFRALEAWIVVKLRVLACFAVAATAMWGQKADVILFNGKILTVDSNFRTADSLAVNGDRILGVGTRAEVNRFADSRTRRIDLHGKTVLPGLMDSHVHAVDASMYEFDHPVPDMETVADVLRYVKARAAAVKPGQWITMSQVYITRLRDQRFPTRAELDQAAPNNPVYFETGPDAAVNSLALKLSGIDKSFKITDGQPGRVERDANGEPTGILRNCSRLIHIQTGEKEPTEEDRLTRLKMLLADYNSVGITSISERDLKDDGLKLYEQLRDRNELQCRVYVMLDVDAQMPVEKIKARMLQASESPLHRNNTMLWLRGIKTFLDGGMLTGSAYMLQPWGVSKLYSITDPNYRGMRYIEQEKLYQIARFALEHDLQYTAHSVGDGAVQAMVDAYSKINNDFPLRNARPCITHSNFIPAGTFDKMKQIGIVLDLQPAWLWLDGATLEKQFGYQRLTNFQPYKTLFDRGILVGGGSDHMLKIGSFRSTNPYNPFLGMWITLTRQPRWADKPLHPEQRISREQALRLYTINNATLTFSEKDKGSLEPGKLADFIVIDRDFMSCPLNDIKDTHVEQTWLGGKLIYQKQ